ncbi:MAG TPA: hypothetical protein VJV78_26445 [Polyangiales bacterium]|nr:hypothetical protein [Polyangiales bacterium]
MSEESAGSVPQPAARPWLDYLVCLVLALVFLKNYWVSEDAYLNLRSVDQLLSGHGPIWNPHERVQVFTSPLWFWLEAGSQLLAGESHRALLLLSGVCFGFALVLLRKLASSSDAFALAGLLLLGSSACFDYTSSGLENVLGYCLLLAYLRAYLEPVALRRLCLAAGLLLVCRHDFAALIAPSLVYALFRQRANVGVRGWVLLAGLVLAPLAAWSLFSLIYYGSAFPNPAYAKLSSGFPRVVFLQHGFDYLAVLVRYDLLSALCIVCGILTLALQRTDAYRWLAASLAMHVAYVAYVGGDYMQGRFLSYVTLASIAMLSRFALAAPSAPWLRATVVAALIVYGVAYPRTPWNTSFAQPKDDRAIHAAGRDYVMDARGAFGVYTGLYSYLQAAELDQYPEHPLAIAGRQFARSDKTVAVIHAAGMFGWAAGTSKIVIEAHGISDVMLAHLPASVFAGVGHYLRYRPEGYVDGMMRGKVELADPDLRTYYSKVALITQGPRLFAWERLRTIVSFNAGSYDALLEHFVNDKIRGREILEK